MDSLTIIEAPLKKQEQNAISEAAIEQILSGDVNPLQIEMRLRALENIIKTIRDNPQVKDAVIDEAAKYSGKTFDLFGCVVTKSQKTTKNYKTCNDEVLATLENAVKARKAALDAGVDPSTGEILTGPSLMVTEYLTVNYK